MRPYQLPTEIASLTPGQRTLLDTWIADPTCTIENILEKFPVEFGKKLSKGKLERYIEHHNITDLIEETTDTEAHVEDLLAIYNGQPTKIPEAALNLLYQRAFKIIADPKTKKSMLLPMFRIITYKDRQDWLNHKKHIENERIAIHHRRETTREKTLTHKIHIDTQKLTLATARNCAASGRIPDPKSQIPNQLNPEPETRNQKPPLRAPEVTAFLKSTPFLRELARNHVDTPEEALEFAEPDGSMPMYYSTQQFIDDSLAQIATEKAAAQEVPPSSTSPTPVAHCPSPIAHAEGYLCPSVQSVDLANCPSPIAHSETNTSTPTPHALLPSGVPAVESQIPDPKSQIPNSLEERVAAYILARYLEARDGRNPQIVGKNAAWNFKSQLRSCPCGNELPCNDHGDFPDHFWTTDPTKSDFMDHMHAHGFDLSLGWSLIREYNQQQRIQALERAEAAANSNTNSQPL